MGINHALMLTGDNQMRAEKIANAVGMYEVKAELLPDGKVREVEKLKKTGTLVYVGDGINDAPVMAASDCAVSMGKLGSAAAVEASDLVLISDSFSSLVNGFKTARKTRKIVIQNIVFSIVMKVAFMALSFFGVLDLWLAVFADVGVSVIAILNAMRVLNVKQYQ
jgi:Cd2+/Zn2+-exporting ATPase